ncbi:tripartite tricarboxylate transporter substrate-binding protein [Rhodoplanes sp. TEM]|uniref:Tripartite tricarboxylate transporter substrate-binding protein n=1 Tax=Rhodoplanes tepidamans TaxID=200616 RepID=A0ABT5J484_RHOTP|nr:MULTISPECIES: tripartite tricarboxylate transporter substrate-binding protein [Rhodoplanes]MDC7784449.1 tripartite tricarboxylate transporter substrate-binding protein [Rhodoplanes tepidamans]MDC7983479.1 tripartite tricarboxylate transporter substrate-binding protein [Rhodoplanes sp. TEM]MDQ0356956.1 tripartite-type tricarboxylate transporter receptor subunit TctC [Rhodoplanes tepidamans]
MTQSSRRQVLAGLTALTAAGVLAGPARAQAYPQRPIKVVVPYAAGGASDIVARLVAVPMGQDLGQSLYVDNRGGGASQIGTQAIASSAPDGYAVGVVDSAFTINPGLFGAKLPYDTKRDFTPISLLARTSLVLVVPASLPVSSVEDLVKLGKAKPGSLTMATAGMGTAVHLGCEQFRQEAGLDVVSVPYRGGGPAIMDLIAGKVDFNFSTIPAVLEHIRAGKLKALGITTGHVAQLPGVPSMAEAGLPKVDAAPDFGLVGPANLPPDILARLAKAARAAVSDAAIRKRMEEIGYEPIGSTPQDYAAHIDTMIAKWKHIIEVGNIKPE